MKDILLFFRTTPRHWCFLFIPAVATLMMLSADVQAQFPFIQRKTWDGPYDIKMIAAPNLEAVYLNPSQASSGRIKADSVIKYSTMVMTGNLFEINNRYKGGSPFNEYDIPLPAVLCSDPNAPCTSGITLNSPNSTCGTERYNNPTTVSKYVAMTYPDYDNDMSTYSSSMAQLDISACSEIEAAYLYWTGAFRGSATAISLAVPTPSYNGNGDVFNTSLSSGYQTIKFKIPGGTYQNVTATAANTRNDQSRYLCVADVTSIVQGTGGGQFWAGNIQSYPHESDGGSSSGWVLVVIFRSPLSPPRLISLWDGLQSISQGTSQQFVLSGLQTPSTSNFKSYVGFGALDGENIASQLDESDVPEGLGFQTNNGGALFDINPLKTDQPHYQLWTKKGYPATCDRSDNINSCKAPLFDANWCNVYDGISSSHITSYNEITDRNGNEIVRLPSNRNTLGLDAHHMRLPPGAVAPGATQATLTVKAGPQGGTTPFFAYIAIERLQPKLSMTKWADKNATSLNTEITYTLRIKNQGNDKSLGGDIVYDTLDAATDYVTGSLTSKRYQSGVATAPAPGLSLVSSAGGNLEIKLANSILPNDSVDITFKVKVKDYTSAKDLWDVQCKRSILNTAYIRYNTISSGVLMSKSNSNDCGIGSETKVLLFDAQLGASTVTPLGPYNACPYINESIITHVRKSLSENGVSQADINEFDIRDINYLRIRPENTFFDPGATMSYYAIRDYNTSGNCQQIFRLDFTCLLPVELVSFTGWKDDAVNILRWTTASEDRNNYFVVERSTDGIDFTPIGVVQGAGSSSGTNTYRFTDFQPAFGNNYYRLKQVDTNGSFSYSKIISVNGGQASIDIYPNPSEGSFSVRFHGGEGAYTLYLTNAEGKTVYSASGVRLPQSIEVTGLAPGMYIAHLELENVTLIKKLIVY